MACAVFAALAPSRVPQIRLILQFCNHLVDRCHLGTLDGVVEAHVVGTKIFVNERRSGEQIKCCSLIAWQHGCSFIIAVADDRRRRCDLAGNAVVRAGEDRGDYQIGVGIGAGDTMFDARCREQARREP